MTTDEMEKRWSECPPNKVTIIILYSYEGDERHLEVHQDSIDDIIEYFEAARESMN